MKLGLNQKEFEVPTFGNERPDLTLKNPKARRKFTTCKAHWMRGLAKAREHYLKNEFRIDTDGIMKNLVSPTQCKLKPYFFNNYQDLKHYSHHS